MWGCDGGSETMNCDLRLVCTYKHHQEVVIYMLV